MEKEFYKNSVFILIFNIIMIMFFFALFIIGIILTIKSPIYIIVIVFGLVLTIFWIYHLFDNEKILSKITFSTNSISVYFRNKLINNVSWLEISEINVDKNSTSNKTLLISSEKTQIDLYLTKKKYQFIMNICPYDEVKEKINKIKNFEIYRNKDLQKEKIKKIIKIVLTIIFAIIIVFSLALILRFLF